MNEFECKIVGPHSHMVAGQSFPCEKDGKPVPPTPDSIEKCHCQRTSRYDTIDSIYKNHSIDICWTDPTPADSWEKGLWQRWIEVTRENPNMYAHLDDVYDYWMKVISEVRQNAVEETLREVYNLHTYGATAELREKALLIKDFMQKAICDYAKSKGIEL